jgi:hypothetical protein
MKASSSNKYNGKTNHCCCDRSEYGGGEDMRALLPNPENPDISEGVTVSWVTVTSPMWTHSHPRESAAGFPEEEEEEEDILY